MEKPHNKTRFSNIHIITGQAFVERFIKKWGEANLESLLELLSVGETSFWAREPFDNFIQILDELKVPYSDNSEDIPLGSDLEVMVLWDGGELAFSKNWSIKQEF